MAHHGHDWSHLFRSMALLALPIALVGNLLLYALAMLTDTNTWIDFGWFFNHLTIGLAFFIHHHGFHHVKGWINLALLAFFFVKGGGFIFFTRVLKKMNDRRYEEMAAQSIIKNRSLWFFFQFVGQAFIVLLPAVSVYFMFRKMDVINFWFFIGIVLAVGGTVVEHIADMQLHDFITSRINREQEPRSGRRSSEPEERRAQRAAEARPLV